MQVWKLSRAMLATWNDIIACSAFFTETAHRQCFCVKFTVFFRSSF